VAQEYLKPENIEKGLAGIGSTRPEELREQRRRQLEIEKKSVQTRLDQLATSRNRLETGIVQADAAASKAVPALTQVEQIKKLLLNNRSAQTRCRLFHRPFHDGRGAETKTNHDRGASGVELNPEPKR